MHVLDARVINTGQRGQIVRVIFVFVFDSLFFNLLFFSLCFCFCFCYLFCLLFCLLFLFCFFSLDCKKGSKRLIVFLFVCDLHLFFLQCLFIYFFFTLVVLATYSVSVF